MMGTKVILNYPRLLMEVAGTAGWLHTLYIALLAFIVFFIIAKLYGRFEGKDLIDVGQYLGGNVVRVIVGMLTVMFMVFISFSLLRMFAEQMKILAYPGSPITFIMIFFLAGMIAIGYFGLEPLVRFMAILVPVSIIAFLTYLVLLAPYYDFSNLTPLFGKGLKSIFIDGIPMVSEMSELFFIFLIVPFVGSQKNFKNIGYGAIGLTTFFMLTMSIAYTCIFSYPVALEIILPAYEIGRIINYGRFFQRVEPLFIITWATMAFMYLGAAFYFSVYSFQKTFRLEHRKPMVLAFAVLIFTVSMLPANLMEDANMIIVYFRYYSGILTFGVVILILSAAVIKKRREKIIKIHKKK